MFFEKSIKKKLHTEQIESAFEAISKQDDVSLYINKIETRVAAVQRAIKPIKTIDDYITDLYQLVKNAAEQHAYYVIFPEYIFFDLFHLLPGLTVVDCVLNRQAMRKTNQVVHEGNVHLQSNKTLRKLFSIVAQPTEQALLTIMKKLAKHFNMYIYTGTYIHKEENEMYNRGTFINPDGDVLIHQDKVHLTDFEASIGLSRGNRFDIIELPIGKVAVPICMDASYFETFKLVASLQAEIVMIPIANNEGYSKWRAMRGIWGRVQEAYVFGVKSSLNGYLGGMQFTGKAGIFAPCEMTEQWNGILQIAPEPIGEYIVVEDLDVAKLYKAREDAPYFGDQNENFERNLYEKTYLNIEEERRNGF